MAFRILFLESVAWGLIADWGKADQDEELIKSALKISNQSNLHPTSIITVGHHPNNLLFKVKNLVVNPTEVSEGETAIISVNVTNTGEIEGRYTANLIVNGVIEETKEVMLDAGK